jgi:beta-mannosidase
MNGQRINLNGIWLYWLDNNQERKTDPDHLKEMEVPSNWHLSGLPNHAGAVWFKRKFYVNENLKEKESWLNFEGVDYFAEIWLNGTFIGEHEGYFQSFRLNTTDVLTNGENVLIVKVDSPFEEPLKAWPDRKRLIKGVLNHHDCRPGGWHHTFGQSGNTGGIWGNVDLLVTDKIVIDQLKVTTESLIDNSAQMKFNLNLTNLEEKPVTSNISIKTFYKGIEQTSLRDKVVLTDLNNNLEYFQKINEAHLWWTWDYGDPDLYQIKVFIEWRGKSIEYELDFGIRTIRVSEDGQLFLNDQPLFIRGTNVIPAQWFSAYQEKEIERDINLMLEANINAARIHAHITKQEFYTACDEAGLLIWQDFPLQWGYIQTDEFMNSAKKQVIEMVDNLYNHPSIYLWCCHNEPPTGSDSLDTTLAELVRKNDASRYVRPSSTFKEHPYYGWYSGGVEQFIAIPGGAVPSEFGAQALPVLESLKEIMPDEALWPPDWDTWAFHNFQYDQTFHVAHLDMGDSLETFINNSQKYQYRYLKYSIETYRRSLEKPIFGLYQFMFMDCWPAITWSVVDYFRRLKTGYDAIRIAYQPILISFDVPRLEVVNGLNIFNGVYLVNDLNIGFENAVIEIALEDSAGKELMKKSFTVDIPANFKQCLVKTDYLSTQWRIPKEADPGEVVIKGKVKSWDGKLLSENFENLKIVTTYAKEYSH